MQYFGSNIVEGVAESWVEAEMNWVEVGGAGVEVEMCCVEVDGTRWSWVEVDGVGWSWVHGFLIPIQKYQTEISFKVMYLLQHIISSQ